MARPSSAMLSLAELADWRRLKSIETSSMDGVQVFIENVHFQHEKVGHSLCLLFGRSSGEWGGQEPELKALFSFSCATQTKLGLV